jgi:hypothetical protein
MIDKAFMSLERDSSTVFSLRAGRVSERVRRH